IAVTGAASGMSFAVAQLFASRGAFISLADINETALKPAIEPLTGSTQQMVTVVDVCSGEQVDKWIESTMQKYGTFDGAVNMAGIITKTTPITELTDADWDFSFMVNTESVFNCLGAQLRAMKEGASMDSAAIIFGQFGAPGNAAYCASQAAVISLSRTAAKENQKIRVNFVAPGKTGTIFSVNTSMSQGEEPEDVKRGLPITAQERGAEPIEVANVIAFLLSDEMSFVTSAVHNIDGGWVC
ncbi:NAD(P)-binding protein, partial [Dothidotthia symphoricarpi CBS 119687]